MLAGMDKLLLILVLSGNPEADPAAGQVVAELAKLGGARVEVVTGVKARERLAAKGLQDADLIAGPDAARSLSGREPLIIIRLERREQSGDQILESRVWANGKAEAHTAIAGAAASGKDSDRLLSERAVRGITALVAPLLPGAVDTKEHLRDERERVDFAALVRAAEWQTVVTRATAIPEPTPRARYYQVMALGRLGRLEEARAAYDAFAKAHPGHVLLLAAADLLPQEPARGKLREEGNILHDGTAPADDGGNTLK